MRKLIVPAFQRYPQGEVQSEAAAVELAPHGECIIMDDSVSTLTNAMQDVNLLFLC